MAADNKNNENYLQDIALESQLAGLEKIRQSAVKIVKDLSDLTEKEYMPQAITAAIKKLRELISSAVSLYQEISNTDTVTLNVIGLYELFHYLELAYRGLKQAENIAYLKTAPEQEKISSLLKNQLTGVVQGLDTVKKSLDLQKITIEEFSQLPNKQKLLFDLAGEVVEEGLEQKSDAKKADQPKEEGGWHLGHFFDKIKRRRSHSSQSDLSDPTTPSPPIPNMEELQAQFQKVALKPIALAPPPSSPAVAPSDSNHSLSQPELKSTPKAPPKMPPRVLSAASLNGGRLSQSDQPSPSPPATPGRSPSPAASTPLPLLIISSNRRFSQTGIEPTPPATPPRGLLASFAVSSSSLSQPALVAPTDAGQAPGLAIRRFSQPELKSMPPSTPKAPPRMPPLILSADYNKRQPEQKSSSAASTPLSSPVASSSRFGQRRDSSSLLLPPAAVQPPQASSGVSSSGVSIHTLSFTPPPAQRQSLLEELKQQSFSKAASNSPASLSSSSHSAGSSSNSGKP